MKFIQVGTDSRSSLCKTSVHTALGWKYIKM